MTCPRSDNPGFKPGLCREVVRMTFGKSQWTKKIRQFTGEMGTSQYFKQGPEKKMFTLANNNNKKGNQYFFSFMKMAACR